VVSMKKVQQGKRLPAETAFLTFSVNSLLCSRYSVSSKRCFLPARGGGSAVSIFALSGNESLGLATDRDDDEDGSMPSFRSRASSLARWASAFAASRSGSVSRYAANLRGPEHVRMYIEKIEED